MHYNKIQYLYKQAREWERKEEEAIEKEFEQLPEPQPGQSKDEYYTFLVERSGKIHTAHHTRVQNQYCYMVKALFMQWLIALNEERVQKRQLKERDLHHLRMAASPEYQVFWEDLCERGLQIDSYLYETPSPEIPEEMMQYRKDILDFRAKWYGERIPIEAIHLGKSIGLISQLENRILALPHYTYYPLLPQHHPNKMQLCETVEDLWQWASKIIYTWHLIIADTSSSTLDFILCFEDGTRYQGELEITGHTRPELLHSHILDHCEYSTGRKKPFHMTVAQHQDFLQTVVTSEMQTYLTRILDLYQIGPKQEETNHVQ